MHTPPSGGGGSGQPDGCSTPPRAFGGRMVRRLCAEESASCPFSVEVSQLHGRKQEDAAAVRHRDGAVLLAVFDGHRARTVAAFAAQRVPDLVFASEAWPADPEKVLRQALVDCHEAARTEKLRGGSTALLLCVAGGQVTCCNGGDSRAVAAMRDGGSRRLSVDHKANAESEMERLAPGCVEFGRLGGMLEVSRGLGDFDFESDGFTCEADSCSLGQGLVDFVVLASDGLWDVMGDDEVCSFLRTSGVEGGGGRLAERARELGSDDDITVIVAQLSAA